MLNLLVRLKRFNLFSPIVFLMRYNETLSIADVIHSDAGGLGKADTMGDAGQWCPFTLIELIIWFSIRAFDTIKIRFLPQRNCVSNARLFNDFLLTFSSMGVFRWNCHQGTRKWFSSEEVWIVIVLWTWRLHSARSANGLRMSEDGQGQFLLEDQSRKALHHEIKGLRAFINTEINAFNLQIIREH